MHPTNRIDNPPAESAGSPAAPVPIPLLLTEKQAAAALSLSPRKLWELAACGAIRFVKIGACKRFRRVDLEDWVKRGCPVNGQR